MADDTYSQTLVYMEQGGSNLVVKSGGAVKVETGGAIVPNSGTQASHITDPTMTFAAGSIDTGTDMTAAEAAAIVADLAALRAAIASINVVLADLGLTASS